MNIAKFKALLPDMAKKKLSPGKLMSEYAAFLRQFPKCAEVLDKVGVPNGIMPTAALIRILKILDSEKDPVQPKKERKAPAKIPGLTLVHGRKPAKSRDAEPEGEEEEEKAPPKYSVTLHRNAVESEALKGADMYGDAERTAHNKLMREASDAYVMIERDGIATKVNHDQAIKAILGKRPGGTMRCTSPGKGNGDVMTSGRAHQSRACFSHG